MNHKTKSSKHRMDNEEIEEHFGECFDNAERKYKGTKTGDERDDEIYREANEMFYHLYHFKYDTGIVIK